jgi:hypothetical protein
VHRDHDEAERRGLEGFKFFGFALGHHYAFGEQRVGRTDIWANFQKYASMFPGPPGRAIGTPDEVRAHLRKMTDAGVDQVVFIQQAGRNQHEHICESLSLFAQEVMPEFKAQVAERERKKAEELAPYVEAALKRKQWMKPLADSEIPVVVALPRAAAQEQAQAMPVNIVSR